MTVPPDDVGAADGSGLPAPPRVAVEVVADHSATAPCTEGFLRMRRLTLRHRRDGGPPSDLYRYDLVDRAALDAVAIVLAAPGPTPAHPVRVCLRSAIRPPLGLRPPPSTPSGAAQWEIPAGLIEPGEDASACAAREAFEEAGFQLPIGKFEVLGPPVALAPGVLGEQVHFRLAWVPGPDDRAVPPTDGHPVEADAEIRFVTLPAAFRAVDAGRLGDVKTELALHRLRRLLRAGAEPRPSEHGSGPAEAPER